jgi:hypothetical protein
MVLLHQMAIAETIFPPLQQWTFDPQQQTLNIQVHPLASPSYFVLQDPTRIVIDVADTSWGNGSIARSYPGTVSQIRVAQFSEGITRFVLDLSGNPPAPNTLQFRSFPQPNNSVIWQLNLGNSIAASGNTANTTVFNGNMQFPPALLAPPFQGSVTIAPPPIPNNLRK